MKQSRVYFALLVSILGFSSLANADVSFGVSFGYPHPWQPTGWHHRHWHPHRWYEPRGYYYEEPRVVYVQPAPVIVQAPPPVPVIAPPSAAPTYYHCYEPEGYYPQVKSCPDGWVIGINPPSE